MNSYGLAFVLMAAAIHPFRDIFLKGSKHPISAYATICSIWIFICIVHVLIFNEDLRLPVSYWALCCGFFSWLNHLLLWHFKSIRAWEPLGLLSNYPFIAFGYRARKLASV